ncbi:MAG: NAD(P)H-hydrate dehydratase [Chlamydiales bacterium]|nr:NAD(P)H-hydrate dehydratase [Chlamydiales bacterium]
MKIVSPKEMARIESLAYADGCLEADFMEAAGLGVALHAEAFIERHGLDRQVLLLCGHGNNGGDAFVAGRRLLEAGFYVTAILAKEIESCKPLCRNNYQKFIHAGGEVTVYSTDLALTFPSRGIVIDGLFGIGFYGVAREPYSAIIRSANASGLPVLAIDVPSGLDAETGMAEGPAICATETIYLGLPKVGYFLAEGWNHVGNLHYVDFGLPERYIEQAESTLWLPLPEQLHSLLPTIQRDRHKYQAGMVVGLAGSPGMPGAAILASMAVLRAGAGMVKLCHPDGMQVEIAGCPPEVIRAPYSVQNVKSVVDSLNSANATFVGPGMGRSPVAQVLIELALPQIDNPCVIDADALYLLSHNDVKLPKKCVLTPHRGEMARLLHLQGHPELTMDFLKQCQRYAERRNVTLVLKGGPGFILHPKTPIFVNIYGDPGMATAGSGDVLTGIIAAMLAQGLSTHAAALIGVYLHSRAGEAAVARQTSQCCIASDILLGLPEAYKITQSKNA